MRAIHRYRARCVWQGSTGVGYEHYDRSHEVTTESMDTAITLSADAAFRGDPSRLNPEQLVVMAASSCQLLSFLAVAARARIDVVSYRDEGEAEMPEDDRPMRLTTITLRPEITVIAGPTVERVRRLVEVAHDECYIANSLRAEVVVEPEIRFVARHDRE